MTVENEARQIVDDHRSSAPSTVACSVVVVTYNSAETISDCLGAIDPGAEIIVFDNASRDDTVAIVARDYPRVRILSSPVNLGFASAVNRAAALGTRDWTLLVNPDARLAPSCLGEMLNYASKHPTGGIYGAFASFPDGRPTRLSGFHQATIWSVLANASGLRAVFPGHPWFEPEVVSEPMPGRIAEPVDYVSGACLLIRTSLWNDLGGFDPVYFMYGEDADLCLRAQRRGFRPMLVAAARMVHHVGGSSANWTTRQTQLLAGRVTLLQHHWPSARRPWITPLFLGHVLWRLLLTTMLGPFSGRIAAQRERWQAVWQARSSWAHGYQRTNYECAANLGDLPSPPNRHS